MKRIELLNNHKEVYSSFFIENSVILSSALVFNYIPSGKKTYEYWVKSKLPHRIYIWLKTNNSKKISINYISYLNYLNNSFNKKKCHSIISYSNELEKELNLIYKQIPGLEISILIETDINVGLNIHEMVISLSVLIVEYYISHSKLSYFDHLNNVPIIEIYSKFENEIKTIKKLWMLLNIEIDVCSIISSIGFSYYPVMGKEDAYYSFKELNNSCSASIWLPFDISVYYSWVPWIPNKLSEIQSIESHLQNLRSTEKVIHDIDNKLKLENISSWFIKDANSFLNNLNTLWIYSLLHLHTVPENEDEIDECIWILWRTRLFLYTPKIKWNSQIRAINSLFHKSFPKYVNIAVIPFNKAINGGSFVIMSLLDRAREWHIDAKLNLSTEFPWAHCLYNSREDEYDPRWLVVEQDIEKGIVSDMLDKDMFIFRKMGWEYITGAFHDLLDHSDVDVIFDASDRKVYIGWQKTTAKDFFSQSTLVDIFEYIIKHGHNWVISNRELPRSSYTKDKNTMNGKILGPLKKIVLERTWKSLNIKCTWSLIDFKISIKDSSVNMGILERVL